VIRFSFFSFPFFSFLFFDTLRYHIPPDPRTGGTPAAAAHKAHNLPCAIGTGRQHTPSTGWGFAFGSVKRASYSFFYGTVLCSASTVQYLPFPPEAQAKSDDPNPITPYASGSTLFAVKPIIIIIMKKKEGEGGREMKNSKFKSKSVTLLSSLVTGRGKKKERKDAGW